VPGLGFLPCTTPIAIGIETKNITATITTIELQLYLSKRLYCTIATCVGRASRSRQWQA
jgi:hypothetical protein